MTYNTIATMREDAALSRRLIACAAEEGKGNLSPDSWVLQNIWLIVTAPGWEEAWEYAAAQGVENIGASESVITDEMILSVIQPMGVPQPEAPVEESAPTEGAPS
jgi:cellulose synthase/poly-beta-1,6-N-acetylglucosamine synthase-like glycosyltransferase